MRKALIVSTDKYPEGDAGAIRTENFANIFAELGYEPFVTGLGVSTDYQIKKKDGINYISFRDKNNSLINRVKNYFQYEKRLKSFINTIGNIDLIMFVNIPENVVWYIKKYAKNSRIPILCDCVEWYSKEQFKFGSLHPTYRRKDRYIRKVIDHNVKVVSISSYLDSYFKRKEIESIRIPVILDVRNTAYRKKTLKGKRVFLYAGMPGKKDYIKVMLHGFSQLSKDELKKIEVRLVGICEKDLIEQCEIDGETINYLNGSLKCYGRISRNQVLEHLEETDFTMLLRDEKSRYAKAGFPTKIVESLATATPVLTNITSDLQMYINDGINGIIVNSCSAEAFGYALKRAICLTDDEMIDMKIKSRNTAEKYFDYRMYTASLGEFIEK